MPANTRWIVRDDGTELYFTERGRGRPMVFLSPWVMHSAWWEYQFAHLPQRGLRCIAMDRAGHGRSSDRGRGYDFDTLADDVAALFEQLDLNDAVLVAQSMGAGDAVRYVTRHGATRVTDLVLIATITPFALRTADNPDGVEAEALEAGRRQLAADKPGQIAKAARDFFAADHNGTSQAMLDWWVDMVVNGCSLATMLELHRMYTVEDFRDELPRLDLPTLVIHGDKDTSTLLDLTSRPTAALIPGARLIIYEGAAHALPVTHEARLNDDLAAYARPS